MKKSILLLTATALLSMGALTGCNGNNAAPSSESSEVDPEAGWPVHAWSDDEKALMSTTYGTEFDIPSLLPFYYVEGQELKNETFNMSLAAPAGKGTRADVTAYENKLISASFEQCSDSTKEAPHYRKLLKTTYARLTYLDVKVALYDGEFAIDFLLGELVNDHSFAGRDVDLDDQTLLEGVAEAAESYFANYGYSGENALKLPTELNSSATIAQIDFLDYNAWYVKDYYKTNMSQYINGYLFLYVNVLEKYRSIDLSAPAGRIVFSSSAKDAAGLEADLGHVDAAFEGEGYASVIDYKKNTSANSNTEVLARRNNKKFEVKYTTSVFDDGTGQKDGHPGYVFADISYSEYHNYSSTFYGKNTEAKPVAYVEAGGLMMDYVKSYFENAHGGAVFSVGFWEIASDRTLNFTVTDVGYSNYVKDGGTFSPAMKVAGTGWIQDLTELNNYLITNCGWTGIDEDPEKPGSYDHYEYGDYKAKATITGSSSKKVTLEFSLKASA